jgi:hypothetical protein
MKKITQYSLSLLLLSVLHLSVIAQKTSTYAQSTIHLQLEKNIIQVDNFSFTDALGPENQLQHTASFDIIISDDAATQNILRSLQVYTKEQASRQLNFVTLNNAGETLQERFFDNTVVEEILFNTLDATSKALFKATVKIRAGSVKIQKGGSRIDQGPRSKRRAFSSYFSLTLGSLPTARVAKISGLSIKPGDGSYTNLTIEILATDGAAWNQWFLTGAAGLRKEKGNILLLAPDLKGVLCSFSLYDVEIVSYTGGSGNQQAISRATIGLRLKGLAVK